MARGGRSRSSDDNQKREKHDWTLEEVELLMRLLVEEAHAQLGVGGSVVSYTHKWGRIAEVFNARRSSAMKETTSGKCKNKGDGLKTGWRRWKELTHRQTGLGFDPATGLPTYSREWVERKAQENPGIAKLLRSNWPAHLVNDMELIWGQSYANGDYKLNPGGEPVQFPEDQPDDQPVDQPANQTHAEAVQISSSYLPDASDGYIPSVSIEYSNGLGVGGSMDISGQQQGYGNSFGVVGSNRNLGNHPPPTGITVNDIPVLDENTAASYLASLAASAFHGSPYAGVVAGSSSAFQPFMNQGQDQGYGSTVKNPVVMDQEIPKHLGDKPQSWDPLMETSAGPRKHGERSKALQATASGGIGKKRGKGSKGKSVASAEEITTITTGITSAVNGAFQFVGDMRARANVPDTVISLEEAVGRLRSVIGIPRRQVMFAAVSLKNSRENRKFFMTIMDDDDMIRCWAEIIFAQEKLVLPEVPKKDESE